MVANQLVQMVATSENDATPLAETNPSCTDNSTITFDDLYVEWIVSMIISVLCSILVIYIIFALLFFAWKKKAFGTGRNFFPVCEQRFV